MALHGCTQNASDFAAGTRFDSVAESAAAYVVYPEQSTRANPRRCWNWFIKENQIRSGPEPAAILALVDDLATRLPIDRARVYVAGLSAGAAMAAILAEQAPDVFAAAGIMAGVALHASHDVTSALAAMKGQGVADASAVRRTRAVEAADGTPAAVAYARLRVTVWTGALDRTVDAGNAASLVRQFAALLGICEPPAATETRDGAAIARWSDRAGRVRIESWRVEAMGHAWSGGSFRGSHTWPNGPRASDEMMRFFLNDDDSSNAVSLPAQSSDARKPA